MVIRFRLISKSISVRVAITVKAMRPIGTPVSTSPPQSFSPRRPVRVFAAPWPAAACWRWTDQ
ncbi:MAG: hypothetical protein JWO93_335 [Micrococcaceae bacterium]|nr:hypothetical protein [Micrococcaceae bacterium]